MEKEMTLRAAKLVENVANSFGQAYFVFDYSQKRFLYFNKAFESLFAQAMDGVNGEADRLLECVHPQDRDFVVEQYQRLLKSHAQKGVEFRVVLPDQTEKWIGLCWQRQEQDEEKYIAGFAEDISKRKAYLSNILKFNSKKNSTLEILSHDLAAPFTNIEGMVDLLIPELSESQSGAQELASFIKENAKKGSDMIRDFVDNEFLESSEVVLHKERVNITHRIEIMMDNYRKMGKGLISKKFILEQPSEPIFMYVDSMKFMQALNNLISNAIKFTQDNGVITVKVEDKDTTTLITVADDGIGISDHLKPVLFDKFTSARREGVKGEKTVGLGMSIIKNIVELHQGKIWFESQEEVGSTFFVEIPKD